VNDQGSRAPPSRKTERLPGDAVGVSRAAALLRSGGLVAFPTETVYGLGADATDPRTVAGIYAAKERPRFNPLISHVADADAARAQGVFNEAAGKLADAFWPGPLTLVLPAAGTCTICDLARAGLDTLGIRVPSHPLARELLRQVGRPVAAPSANRSGRVSPTLSDHVLGDLDGRIDAVVEGGPARVGVESTIVAVFDDSARLLRLGGTSREEIERVIGRVLDAGDQGSPDHDRPVAPGMLASHYAPRARVRLNARTIRSGEAALLFGAERPEGMEHAVRVINLSASGDPAEAAAALFASLRSLDATGAATIAVGPIPERGLGEAINDRLRRAAAER
jgi:L-threonylcarbamoyladenylate synthase